MSLIIYDNRLHHEPIRASRITPSGLNRAGQPDRSGWDCPRCGRDVDNRGAHLIKSAPCGDCRELLREEYGDETIYDQRRLRRLTAPPALAIVAPPAEVVEAITVRHLSFPLARVGAALDPDQ